MLAIVAAVLFLLGLIFKLAGIQFGTFDYDFWLMAGLLCVALYLAGVGARTWRR
jgi:tetrahydromethanopterin S-methyltransferase subunit C